MYNAARDQLMTKASLVRPFKKVSSGVTQAELTLNLKNKNNPKS